MLFPFCWRMLFVRKIFNGIHLRNGDEAVYGLNKG